jgi:hypothetical protein
MIKRSNPKREQLPLKDQMKNGSESNEKFWKVRDRKNKIIPLRSWWNDDVNRKMEAFWGIRAKESNGLLLNWNWKFEGRKEEWW